MKGGGYAHMFCNSTQVGGAGHVAWGFMIGKTKSGTNLYHYGSYDNTTENERQKKVWSDVGTGKDMVNEFVQTYYDGWKYLFVPEQSLRLKSALQAEKDWLSRWYFPTGSNCLNAVHDILSAYGTPCLPKHYPNSWLPVHYFANFQGSKGKLGG